MDIGNTGLSDCSILDSSIDSVDSVFQKQIEHNKILIKMAISVTDMLMVTGRNKKTLGPPKQILQNTLTADQSQNVSLDDSVDSSCNFTVDILTNKLGGFRVLELSKHKYLSRADIVQHFYE